MPLLLKTGRNFLWKFNPPYEIMRCRGSYSNIANAFMTKKRGIAL